MRKMLLIISFFIYSYTAISQLSINYFDVGNDFYKKNDFISAIFYYEKYLSPFYENFNNSFTPYTVSVKQKELKDNNTYLADALYRTAESYRRLSIHDKAVNYYREVLKKKSSKYPLIKFHYAHELKALGQFAEAKQMIESFLVEYKKNDSFKKKRKVRFQVLIWESRSSKKRMFNILFKSHYNLSEKIQGLIMGLFF